MNVHPNDCPRPEECGCTTHQSGFCLEEPTDIGHFVGGSYDEGRVTTGRGTIRLAPF